MKNRIKFYMLSVVIGLCFLICICILTTRQLRVENTMVTHELEKYMDKINSLEKQNDEYQKALIELNSQNKSLQKSLNEVNEWNRTLEIQLEKNNTANEVRDEHYGNYQGNDDFSEIIINNPIDKDYWIEYYKLQESENITTLAQGALESKYSIIWEQEVNAALSYLYKTLSKQDSKNLKQAQKSWQSYMRDDETFVCEKYVYTGFYGTQGKVLIEKVRLNRTRERAIALMEFIFSIDRTAVDFVYDN